MAPRKPAFDAGSHPAPLLETPRICGLSAFVGFFLIAQSRLRLGAYTSAPLRSYPLPVLTCPSCGQENPDGFRFCGACGALLEPEAAERREERKVVTVLFCDLVGSTARAEQMDHEDVRRILSRYHARVKDELERLGGTVEKFIGDAAMAVFGAPTAHEDDPERAVRAALAIRDWAREDEELEVRIAVNTGEALVTLGARPEQGEAMVAGDVVNAAARLQAAAPANGVLVGETTYRATERAIGYREHEPVKAKGKSEPIPVWEAEQARARVQVERVGGAPLVGRDQELSLLREALERALAEREPQLVTLAGVPGIGKSRLVFELFTAIERDTWGLVYWRRGRSLPYGEGVTFWALREMVAGQAGILETDAATEVEEKLHRAVSDLVPDEQGDWLERHLRPLVGVAAEGEVRGDHREEAFAAWRRFFEALAERRPLVLVFEDLHWADEALLDFVDELVDWATGVPLLVLCTLRPELLTRRPGWGGGKPNAVTISLSPLSDEETARLVHALLDRAVLPAETQAALLANAGGNPLYAEEFVRLAQERGLEGGEGSALPESVQGIIAARLDGLPADDKGLLQNAAVLGRVFWEGAIASLAGLDRREVEQRLHGLERREFVRRERRPSVAGMNEYSFRHLLVRDVAYSQIPRAARGDKHRRAAEWIESLGRPEDHAEMLAHHYLSALELARAANEPTEELAERARNALREAGDRASALGAFPHAARFYASALELWPRDDQARPSLLLSCGKAEYNAYEGGEEHLVQAVEELAALGDRERAAEGELVLAELRRTQRDRAYEHLGRAVKLLEEEPPSAVKAHVLAEVSRFHMLGGRGDEAIAVGREALAMAESLGLEEVRASALSSIGLIRAHSGDKEGLGELERSVQAAVRTNSPWQISRAYNNLGSAFMALGDLRRCGEVWSEGWQVVARFGEISATLFLRYERIYERYWTGNWDEALPLADHVISTGVPAAHVSWAYELRGRIRLARGDTAGALEDAERSLALAREAKDPQALQPAVSFCSFVRLAAGRRQEAATLADELLALDPVRPEYAYFHGVSPVFDLAWVLVELGREAELLEEAASVERLNRWIEGAAAIARSDLEHAAEVYLQIGNLGNEALCRLRAAEKLAAEGRRVEADAQLQRALAFWRSVGATRFIREGEALLAAAAIERTSTSR
jgi:class 3 adenylate cyclase/tetratricopeptide (TPR) repeat protein